MKQRMDVSELATVIAEGLEDCDVDQLIAMHQAMYADMPIKKVGSNMVEVTHDDDAEAEA